MQHLCSTCTHCLSSSPPPAERFLDKVSMGGRSESFLQEEVPTLAWTKAGNVSLVNPRHIEGCESLLETYFMQVSLSVCLCSTCLTT